MSQQETFRYVWLNIETGEFSDSWSEDDHQRYVVSMGLLESVKNDPKQHNAKLIKYQCLTDEDFEFYRKMKLR